MSTWSFGSVGASAANTGLNTTPLVVNYPAGISAGDILLLAVEAATAGVTLTPSDITSSLAVRTTNGVTQLFGKVATGSESGSINLSCSATGWVNAQIARFSGGLQNMASIVHNSSSTGSSASTGLQYAALTVTQPNCLILTIGGKKVNVTGYTPPAEVPNEIGDFSGSTQNSLTWDYLIQTTATNIVGGSWTITGDSSAARSSLTVALLPAISVKRNNLMLSGYGR